MLKSRIFRFFLAAVTTMAIAILSTPALCIYAVDKEGYWFDDDKNLYYYDELISEYEPNEPAQVDYVDPSIRSYCEMSSVGFGRNLDSDGAGEYEPGEYAESSFGDSGDDEHASQSVNKSDEKTEPLLECIVVLLPIFCIVYAIMHRSDRN